MTAPIEGTHTLALRSTPRKQWKGQPEQEADKGSGFVSHTLTTAQYRHQLAPPRELATAACSSRDQRLTNTLPDTGTGRVCQQQRSSRSRNTAFHRLYAASL